MPIKHIMISYSHADSKIVTEIHNELKKHFEVWIDFEKMEGDVVAQMAQAIDESSHVLVALSNSYEKSKNCMKECSYAANHSDEKVIVPLILYENYKMSSGMRFTLGNALRYNFREPFQTVMAKIVAVLQHQEANSSKLVTTTASTPRPPTSKTPSIQKPDSAKSKADIVAPAPSAQKSDQQVSRIQRENTHSEEKSINSTQSKADMVAPAPSAQKLDQQASRIQRENTHSKEKSVNSTHSSVVKTEQTSSVVSASITSSTANSMVANASSATSIKTVSNFSSSPSKVIISNDPSTSETNLGTISKSSSTETNTFNSNADQISHASSTTSTIPAAISKSDSATERLAQLQLSNSNNKSTQNSKSNDQNTNIPQKSELPSQMESQQTNMKPTNPKLPTGGSLTRNPTSNVSAKTAVQTKLSTSNIPPTKGRLSNTNTRPTGQIDSQTAKGQLPVNTRTRAVSNPDSQPSNSNSLRPKPQDSKQLAAISPKVSNRKPVNSNLVNSKAKPGQKF